MDNYGHGFPSGLTFPRRVARQSMEVLFNWVPDVDAMIAETFGGLSTYRWLLGHGTCNYNNLITKYFEIAKYVRKDLSNKWLLVDHGF